ncbi:hypothetical protein Bca52824_042385 [Brassica carinata]|uniref:Uncharacterized protein n=1 Tax=Brassica carinata TaxID=52824 RepID=A0A8X7V0V6_BRACI|nr:hypothetical protein Bca52824_042385 [Brassica carinata]
MAAPSLPLDVPSSSMANLSSPLDVPSLPTADLSSPLDVPSLPTAGLSLPTVVLSSPTDVPSLPTAGLSSPLDAPKLANGGSPPDVPSLFMVTPNSSPVVTSGLLLVKECGRDAEGTSLPLVGSSSAFVSSSSVPSSFLGSSLSFAVPSLPLSMELCHGELAFRPNLSSVVLNMLSVMETLELSSLIGMPSDGKVAREQLSLLVHKMELADGRKSWSEIADSVIAVELGTLTRSEAEDRVSASLIEEGTGFLFDEHGTNLAVEPGVEGSRLSLTTPLIVPSSSSLVKKTMLETVRKYEQMRLANSSQTKESSSETTNDKRDDDIENVDVEDDGALESAYDEWNGTCDVNFGEESDQDEYASDGDHAADSFSGEQSGVSGSLGAIVVDDGSDDTDGGSDRRADVTDILRKIKQESVAASLAGSLDALGNPCGYGKKKKRVRKARERPRSFVGPLDTIKWISANCCRNGVIEARIPGEDDRPWTVPEGLLLAYCDEHLIALAQLTPAAIRNIVAALFTAADIGVHMSLCLFERIAHITRCDKTDGAFYVSMKAGCGVVGMFFYVRIAPSSVPDVSDMSVPFRSSWNPYNGRHLVGVPLAETKARDWTVVRRSEVWRRIPFIDLACWRKIDLSEILSLVDCFAGGIDDASVVESGQCAAGVEPSASARSIVMGLMSSTVPVPSADVSEKEVVVTGSGSVVAKRAAAGRSPKDVPPSKSRKIVSSDVELPLVVESPAAEKASFESFEHSFNGLASGCGDLFKRGEWYQEFARHLAIATKFANKLVVNQDEELEEVKVELEKTKAELASIKDKADGSEEIAALRGKYEAEKKVSSDALEEVEKLTAKIALEGGQVKKSQAADLERFKKEKEVAGRRYHRAVMRHDDVLATFNSRMEKERRYVENQKVVRIAMYGVNQIMGVLDAAKTWKKEATSIPDGKVKHLENELVRRKEKANLVVRVEFEPKELADIPTAGPSLLTAGLSSPPVAPNSFVVAPSSSPDVTSGSLLEKEYGRDAEGTSLPLVGSSSAFVSSSVPSSFLGSSLPFAVPSLSLSMELCHSEVGLSLWSFGLSSSFVPNLSSVVQNMPSVMETSELSSLIGMPSDGKVACEQLSLLVHKMELADGRKSWSEIAESVIVVELGTLTGSEAEDRVSMSLIEEGTGFLFNEHGTNLAVEPGVEGSRLSLATPLIVPSSSSLMKKTMLETVREHEQMRLANLSQTKESSSETTSSSDDSLCSSSHSEKSVDSADVAGEYDDISEDVKRDDDVESVGGEDDGALGSVDDEWNGNVNVGEESDQDEYASDGDHAAAGDDEMGDRDGVK